MSLVNGVGRLDRYTQRMKVDYQLTPYTRINSKWIKDINLSWETIKILEENIGSKISDISHRKIFPDTCPRAREIEEQINKWDCIKLKSLCMAKKKKQTTHQQNEKDNP